MNGLDIVISVILAFSLIYGLIRGFTRIFLLFLSMILGIIFAYRYAPYLAPVIDRLIPRHPQLSLVLSFIIIVCWMMLLFALFSYFIRRFLKVTGLSFLDRIVGGLLSLLIGVFISTALVYLLAALLPPRSRVIRDSVLAPRVVATTRLMGKLIPHRLRREWEEKYRQVRGYFRSL
ncbi:MAG: CvpA family protein [Acidobacteria bacterium]|nr:CvpA family protein [Acidobacteriota bacterium]